jgi:fumarate hydratase class II
MKEATMGDFRKESDSLGEVNVPADKLWGEFVSVSVSSPLRIRSMQAEGRGG